MHVVRSCVRVCNFQRVTHCFAVLAQLGVFESKKPVCASLPGLQVAATIPDLSDYKGATGVYGGWQVLLKSVLHGFGVWGSWL